MLTNILTVAILATSALAHGDHEHQVPIAGPHKALWYNTLPGDGGTQVGQLSPHIHKEYVLTVERPIRSSLVSRLSVACHIFRVWLRMKQRMILPFSVRRSILILPLNH